MSSTVYRSRKGPRVGSWAYLALRQLHKDGGTASINDWMSALAWRATRGRFNREIVDELVRFGLIVQLRLQVKITEVGLQFLDAVQTPVPQPKPNIAPPPYVAPMRALSLANRPRPCVVRPGAFDYREIPSRHGDVQVPFKSSVKLPDEVANG